jgi:UDP-glucose 4-epimerase
VAVLVTGVGYIGAALVQALLHDGAQVVGLDNGFATDRRALAALAESPRFQLVEGSVSAPRAVARAFAVAPIDTVYHLAAQASAHPRAAPARYTELTNLCGPRVVCEAALRHGVRQLVYASSLRVYGHALPEEVSEATPYGPQQDLAHLAHVYGEKLLELYARRGGFRGVAVRLGVVYGVGPVMKTDPRFMTVPNKFCWQAARGEPLEIHPGAAVPTGFLHLDDAVAALRRAAEAPWPEPYQAANAVGECRTVPEVAALVRQAAAARGLTVTVHGAAADVPPARPTIASRLAAQGWRPRRTMETSIGAVLDHFLRGAAP